MQLRHEYKHYISYSDSIALRRRLQAVMATDPYAAEKGSYQVRSLYFDNPADKVLREKINGISKREKFRIRCYDFNYDFIRLEKKVKQGELGYKLSAPLSRQETERLLGGDINWMRTSGDALLLELYEKMQTEGLRPKTIVDYTRQPFIYRPGNVRVTIDREIKTGIFARDMLDRDVPTIPSCPGTVILEVKYDNYLPDMIRDAIQLKYREETAFSKYASCRRFG